MHCLFQKKLKHKLFIKKKIPSLRFFFVLPNIDCKMFNDYWHQIPYIYDLFSQMRLRSDCIIFFKSFFIPCATCSMLEKYHLKQYIYHNLPFLSFLGFLAPYSKITICKIIFVALSSFSHLHHHLLHILSFSLLSTSAFI